MIFDNIKADLINAIEANINLKTKFINRLSPVRNLSEVLLSNESYENPNKEIILKIEEKSNLNDFHAPANIAVERETIEMDASGDMIQEQLSENELKKVIHTKIREINATGPQDMARLMSVIMQHVKGRTDGKIVNSLVRDILTG